VGVVSTFPRALAHAPKKYFGLAIPDFYIKQGVAHIKRLVQFSKSAKHPTACLLRHSAELMRIQLGCNGAIFHIPWQCYGLLDDSWLKSMWEFVNTFGVRIDDDIPELAPWREHDVLLIPAFLQLGYSGAELRWLNMCRLYYKVSWLSEVCSGNGNSILRCFLEGAATAIITTLRYPNQGFPPKSAWITWKRALSRLCNSNQFLHHPLGNWVRTPNWFFDPTSERLFHLQVGQILEYQAIRTRRSRNSWATFAHPVYSLEIPTSALPATVIPGQNPTLTGYSKLISSEIPPPGTFRQFLSGMHPDARWVAQKLEMSGDWDMWATGNHGHRVQGVSDGSFKDHFGTAAFILVITDQPPDVHSLRGGWLPPATQKITTRTEVNWRESML
jgi:hypothetical protein